MNKCCPSCNTNVGHQALKAFLLFKAFDCKNCKTRLINAYDEKLSLLFSLTNFFLGFFLGFYKLQNYYFFFSVLTLAVVVNWVWFKDCKLTQTSSDFKMTWPEYIIGFFSVPLKKSNPEHFLKYTLLVAVFLMIWFKYNSGNYRIPAGLKGERPEIIIYDYVEPPVGNVEYP